jgi:hypothetical protein
MRRPVLRQPLWQVISHPAVTALQSPTVERTKANGP